MKNSTAAKEIKSNIIAKKKFTKKKTFVKRDVYQEVTDKIIAALEAAEGDCKKLPWLKPWKDSNTGASLGMPHNAATGRAYSGMNVMLLWMGKEDHSSNGWLTFNQCKELGGNVKGETGTQIVLFKPIKIVEGKGTPDEEVKNIPMVKFFTVFNVDQCNLPVDAKIHKAADIPEFKDTTVSEIAKKLGAKMEVGGNRACFIPSADLIQMPNQNQFKTEEHFEAVLSHELTHWTGGKKRLDRITSTRFGDSAYAFEELIAEIGSAYLCAQLGIQKEEIQSGHESYIQSWIDKLKDDKKAIFGASSMARQSNEWILENLAASK